MAQFVGCNRNNIISICFFTIAIIITSLSIGIYESKIND